jgi:serine/threonine-protein kinase
MSVDPASPFHEALDRFEEAWQEGVPPALGQFIPSDLASEGGDGADTRRRLLIELVKIDLNHRWRRAARTNVRKTRPIRRLRVTMLQLPWPVIGRAPVVTGSPPTAALPACPSLANYATCFPELGPVERLPADLIAEEYWARTRAGEVVDRQAYLTRYGPRAAELEPVLAELEPELAVGPVYGHTLPGAAASNRSVFSPLLDALRETGLLTSKQLSELADLDLQGQIPDGASLHRELRARGWLTAYQIDHLLAGDLQALTLGPYQLLEPLGEGIVGRVFKARHKDMGRLVALKIIRQEVLATPQALARFYREIRVGGRIFHPHIVQTYDAGPSGNTHSLAMEYVEGIDLDRLVRASGPLPVPQATAYVAQTAEALQYLLEHGLVHRDIKPSNLMVTREGTAITTPWGIIKLVDLGLALLRPILGDDAITSLTAIGTRVGTPDFMAPEQAMDAHAVDIRADLYSLGCTWYYLLTGQVPFPGGTLAQKLTCHQVQEPRPVRRLRSDVPLRLAAILRKLMAKRPEDRYQKPVDLLTELHSAGGGLSRPAGKSGDDTHSQSPTVLPLSVRAQTVPVQLPEVSRTFPRISYGWLIGGMVLSVLILVLVAWVVFS